MALQPIHRVCWLAILLLSAALLPSHLQADTPAGADPKSHKWLAYFQITRRLDYAPNFILGGTPRILVYQDGRVIRVDAARWGAEGGFHADAWREGRLSPAQLADFKMQVRSRGFFQVQPSAPTAGAEFTEEGLAELGISMDGRTRRLSSLPVSAHPGRYERLYREMAALIQSLRPVEEHRYVPEQIAGRPDPDDGKGPLEPWPLLEPPSLYRLPHFHLNLRYRGEQARLLSEALTRTRRFQIGAEIRRLAWRPELPHFPTALPEVVRRLSPGILETTRQDETVVTPPPVRTLAVPGSVTGLDWHPRTGLAASGYLGTVYVWPAPLHADSKPLEEVQFHPRGSALSPDGVRLALPSKLGMYLLRLDCNPSDYQILATTEGKEAGMAAWSADGTRLAVADAGPRLMLWGKEGERRGALACAEPVTSLSWRPGSVLLTTSHADGSLITWNTVRQTKAVRLPPLRGSKRPEHLLSEALPVAWSPDGGVLAAARGNQVELLDPAGKRLRGLPRGRVLPNAFCWSPDGTRLAGASEDGVWIWDPETGKRVGEFRAGTSVFSLAWSPDGRHLAAGCWDGRVLIWRVSLQNVK